MIFSWILERDTRLYARASSAYHGHLEERKRQEMTSKDDHIERTKRMIEVMQAYVDGKPIESMTEYSAWQINPNPLWDFRLAKYRIAETSDSINWDHVAPEFNYMARNKNGAVSLFREAPRATMDGAWSCFVYERPLSALSYASYRKGTCDWKDSLVIRPGFE